MLIDSGMPDCTDETEKENIYLTGDEEEFKAIFDDGENFYKGPEYYRLMEICKKFPEHCIQLCFLS